MTPILSASMLSVMAQPSLAELETVRSDLSLSRTAQEMSIAVKALGVPAGPVHRSGNRVWVDLSAVHDEGVRAIAECDETGAVWITFHRAGSLRQLLCA